MADESLWGRLRVPVLGAVCLALFATGWIDRTERVGLHDYDAAAAHVLTIHGGVLIAATLIARRGWPGLVVTLVGGAACSAMLVAMLRDGAREEFVTVALTGIVIVSVGLALFMAIAAQRAALPPEPEVSPEFLYAPGATKTERDDPLGFVPQRRRDAGDAPKAAPPKRRRYEPKI